MKNTRVPRYTSYPTAPHFNESVDNEVVKKWYGKINETASTSSIYVHIPFCQKLCLFCGCHMKVINTYEPVKHYLKYLEKEIKIIANTINNHPKVEHLHFGGGSPTALSGDDFISFMKVLSRYFPISKQTNISVEIDPRTVNDEKIDSYVKAGMNRMSIGVQDFNEQVQKSVNRIQSFELVKSVIDSLVKRGVQSINLDIMYGLPFQTIDTIKQTVHKVLELKPDRLAVFGYAHVPWMKKHQNLIPTEALAGGAERWEMYLCIKEILANNGYLAIGLDHFALSDDAMATAYKNKTLRRNFQGYTTDVADALIGIGHSSIGWLEQGYIQNTSDPVEYTKALDEGFLPIKKGRILSLEDKIRRRIIESIMCYMSVDIGAIKSEFNSNISFNTEFSRLRSLMSDDLLNAKMFSINDEKIEIHESGRIAIRLIASIFDTYLTLDSSPPTPKHSLAV